MGQMGPQLCAQHPTSQWDSQGAAWASTRGMDSGTGTAAFHFSPDISVALSSQSLLPWFLSIHCILLSSSLPVSVLFSLSLSGRVSLHAFLLPLLVLLLSLPPLLGTSSSQPRLHPLSLLCLPPCPPLALPEGRGLELPPSGGRGEHLSCTHGVDQKRLEFSGSDSALDVILIKPRCLVKQ